jgi:hypothetical protein
MKKYRYLSIFLIIIMGAIFILGGCTTGSGVVKNGTEFNSSTRMSMLYDEFNGYKQTHINVGENETVEVVVSIITENGSIDAYIAKDNDISNSSYEGHNIPTSSFTVTLSEEGSYTVRVDAKNHTGGYSFSWGE